MANREQKGNREKRKPKAETVKSALRAVDDRVSAK